MTAARSLRILLLTPRIVYAATLNLNGDYLSDALAAQVGGIGIAPGVSRLCRLVRSRFSLTTRPSRLQGNINYKTGHAIFEATHGTAPK